MDLIHGLYYRQDMHFQVNKRFIIVDFRTVTKEQIQDITIPFTWVAQYTGLVHGIGAWFDINLGGYILSTAPHAEKTHWHQVRLLFKGIFYY